MTTFNTFSKSLLGLTFLAACTNGHALSLTSLLHVHPHLAAAGKDQAQLRLNNTNSFFRDIKVADRTYTVSAHQSLSITAPVGTAVYAASGSFRKHINGSVLALVEPGSRTLSLD